MTGNKNMKTKIKTGLIFILFISIIANVILAIDLFREEKSLSTYKGRLYQWKLDDRQRMINLKNAYPTMLKDLEIPPPPTPS